MAGSTKLPQPTAPSKLLPTVIMGWVLSITPFAIKLLGFSWTPFGIMKKATSVTGVVKAAVGSEKERVYNDLI